MTEGTDFFLSSSVKTEDPSFQSYLLYSIFSFLKLGFPPEFILVKTGTGMTEKRDFGEKLLRGERLQKQRENSGKIHFMKSHFADEERLRGNEEKIRRKDFGLIHLYEVSLRRRRETSEKNSFAGRDFGDGERIRGKKTWDKYILGSLTSRTKREFGDGETLDKYIFVKSHFGDEERLRRKERIRKQRDKYIFVKSHFADEERLREQKETSRDGETSEEKDFGQIHIRKSHFADEERLRGQGETSGKKTWGKYILGSLTSKTKRDFEEKCLRGRRETS